jgi:hypothetical protein
MNYQSSSDNGPLNFYKRHAEAPGDIETGKSSILLSMDWKILFGCWRWGSGLHRVAQQVGTELPLLLLLLNTCRP